jgi:hypothetical protein
LGWRDERRYRPLWRIFFSSLFSEENPLPIKCSQIYDIQSRSFSILIEFKILIPHFCSLFPLSAKVTIIVTTPIALASIASRGFGRTDPPGVGREKGGGGGGRCARRGVDGEGRRGMAVYLSLSISTIH